MAKAMPFSGEQLENMTKKEWINLNISEFILHKLDHFCHFMIKQQRERSSHSHGFPFSKADKQEVAGPVYEILLEPLTRSHSNRHDIPCSARIKFLEGTAFTILKTRGNHQLSLEQYDETNYVHYDAFPDLSEQTTFFANNFCVEMDSSPQQHVSFASLAVLDDENSNLAHHFLERISHKLTPFQYSVLRLRIIEGVDYIAIAEILDISRNYVWQLCLNARKLMLEMLPPNKQASYEHLLHPHTTKVDTKKAVSSQNF